MEFGLTMFPAHFAIDPKTLGRAAEERGFESLFFPEHTHIPVASRRAGHDQALDGYAHAYDPFVALSQVAAVTETLKVGTAVCLVVQRDPLITAKAVASLDRLSGGRLLFGVGAGWNRSELANHGTDPVTRMALLAERVHAMREIWTTEQAAYHGRFVDFEPLWSWPKPVQQPHPPVLVGGNGPTAEGRVLAFGDEWLPERFRFHDNDELRRRAATLQERAVDVGRGPIPISLFGALPNPEAIASYADAGVTRCIFQVPAKDADIVLRELDKLAALISDFRSG